MATVTLKGNPIETIGELPKKGDKAPAFSLVKDDLSALNSTNLTGRLVLNIFPSVDTGTCAKSVRNFNEKVSALHNTTVVCISRDLPFALTRFCGAEGIHNVQVASDFRTDFGEIYGITFKTGPLTGLLSRAVVVIDENGKVIYTEQVAETADEPNYDAALQVLA